MTHKVQNFDIHQGDTLDIEMTVTENGEEDGDVIDLTACTITFGLADTSSSPTRAITKTVGDGITITDAGQGEMLIHLAPEDTQELAGIYQYQVRVTDPVGNKTTVIKGTVNVDLSILGVDE